MRTKKRLIIFLQLVATSLFSWLILPLILLPSHAYAISYLLEVLFWQVIAIVGWPIAIFGMLLMVLFGSGNTEFIDYLLILLYPAMLLLFLRVFLVDSSKLWEFILLHILILLSFTAMWVNIYNGYDFMVGLVG